MDENMGEIHERWTYDVFLSFRGEDVRKGFLSHIYESLGRSGVYTFKDNEELERGENISAKLLKAIENSKILLVVLSQKYASSAWCLDELAHIMECRGSESGQMVFPILYNVDPSDVRRQRGWFSEFLDEHKTNHPESKLQKWRVALTQIGNLSGFHSDGYRDEADLIDRVIREILRRLPSSYLHLPTYGVGIRSRVHCIYEMMCFDSNEVQVIGIWGMGGIGKTTLAKAAYNKFSQDFEGKSFLENFGEYFTKPEGKGHLQRLLLADIFRGHDIVFNNMDYQLRQRFRNKKVFVVLDDVKDIKQLNSTAINLACFGPGSRIIITCRNRHLLEQLGVEHIYSPNELDVDESLELLSWHAFRRSDPPEAFVQLSDKLVKYCGGLPLAIEILGAFLFKRSTSKWRSTLEVLKKNPNADIQAKLQISFDALDPDQKEIFLDVSCFFVGMDKDYVDCILDGCNFHPEIGLAVLKERCLITVRDSKLAMHDLLRDMGRNIVRGTSRSSCGTWSRLWDPADVIGVLGNNSGTDAIEGVSLQAGVEKLDLNAFSNVRKLRLLQLCHVEVTGSYEHFPSRLRWLCWFEFPLCFIPSNLHLGKLAVMDLRYSNLKQLWDDKEPQNLKKLKYLDLSHSFELEKTPDFSNLPNLKTLLLINCNRLVLVHESIGTLHDTLIVLNLKDCTELTELPLELYTLKSLETLILSGCSQLKRLDDALGDLESLKTLKADSTALRQIPSTTSKLKKLQELSLDGCKELYKDRDYTHSDDYSQAALSTPLSLIGLSSLKTLRLGSCNLSDELVPENLGSLPCLEVLDLQGNNFLNLQTDFTSLSSLQILKLDSCSKLQSIFNLPKRLRSFYASNCTMLERTPDLSECSVLQSLHLTNCFSLVETPGLDKLKTVGVIHMEMCNRISATYRERIMQGWAVCANGGIFIPGSSLPNWVSFKNETHLISFVVPETLNPDPVGFTLWTPYVSQQDNEISGYSPKITVKNQTKRRVWSRNPATDQIRMYREKHIWQGHFSNVDFVLETGDQVEVSVDFGDQVTILETGLTLTYREETSDKYISTIGYEVIPDEQLAPPEEKVDDEPITEASQSRPHRKKRMGFEKLMSVCCLRCKNEKDEEKDARMEFVTR